VLESGILTAELWDHLSSGHPELLENLTRIITGNCRFLAIQIGLTEYRKHFSFILQLYRPLAKVEEIPYSKEYQITVIPGMELFPMLQGILSHSMRSLNLSITTT
jgi:hypothetical protein